MNFTFQVLAGAEPTNDGPLLIASQVRILLLGSVTWVRGKYLII